MGVPSLSEGAAGRPAGGHSGALVSVVMPRLQLARQPWQKCRMTSVPCSFEGEPIQSASARMSPIWADQVEPTARSSARADWRTWCRVIHGLAAGITSLQVLTARESHFSCVCCVATLDRVRGNPGYRTVRALADW